MHQREMAIPESEMSMILSVVIVNYNVRDLLENTLHSLMISMEKIRVEVFVVDNASDDGSIEMLARKFPQVHIIRNEENIGFAKANNQALQLARGKYFLILNPDTLLQEDTLQVMLTFFEQHPDAGMAGCKIIEPDGSMESNSRRSFPSPWVSFTKLSGLSTFFPKSKLFGRYNLTYLSDEETYEIDALSGCFTMLKREVYDQIGGFDEDYFMYGEDLDWCYRAQRAGWKIYYVHSTKIIHYGGESTKRSSINAKAVFYRAMKLFVKKNLKLSWISNFMIHVAISIRLGISRSKFIVSRSGPILIDMLLVGIAISAGELIRFGGVFMFPNYAYPTVHLASMIIYVLCLTASGTYSSDQYEVARSALGATLGFLVISALVFFFKDFAFSRGVVLISGLILFFLIPGRRTASQLFGTRKSLSLISGRPTLLVGLNDHSIEIINKLRTAHGALYRLVGIIDTNRKRLGDEVEGVKIIGSTENIGKVIFENKITDVIFSPDVVSYAEMFSIISRTKGLPVHYRLAARSMEFIAGKAGIDQLTSVPLVDVQYNLLRFSHRIGKRVMDLFFAIIGLIVFYPFVYFISKKTQSHVFNFSYSIRLLPQVFSGEMSLVGRPTSGSRINEARSYFIKPGITGLHQLQNSFDQTTEEMNKIEILYAQNHTLFLDLEIIFRTIAYFLRSK